MTGGHAGSIMPIFIRAFLLGQQTSEAGERAFRARAVGNSSTNIPGRADEVRCLPNGCLLHVAPLSSYS